MAIDPSAFSASNAGPIWSILGPMVQKLIQQSGGGAAAAAPVDPIQALLNQILGSLTMPTAAPAAAAAGGGAAAPATPIETILQYLEQQYPGSTGWSPYGVTVGRRSRVFAPGSEVPMGYSGQYRGQTIYVSPPSGAGFTQAPGQALPDLGMQIPIPAAAPLTERSSER